MIAVSACPHEQLIRSVSLFLPMLSGTVNNHADESSYKLGRRWSATGTSERSRISALLLSPARLHKNMVVTHLTMASQRRAEASDAALVCQTFIKPVSTLSSRKRSSTRRLTSARSVQSIIAATRVMSAAAKNMPAVSLTDASIRLVGALIAACPASPDLMARIENSSCMGLLRQDECQLLIASGIDFLQKQKCAYREAMTATLFAHSCVRLVVTLFTAKHTAGATAGKQLPRSSIKPSRAGTAGACWPLDRGKRRCVLPLVLCSESRRSRPLPSLIVRICDIPFMPVCLRAAEEDVASK
ncbi:hypothetical protein L1887_54235 [Cichorium endivia]|nr:hypothetical protein L1887_54235 [Cichorium endivia]